MGLTKVRIGARAAKSAQNVVEWLDENIGPFTRKESIGVTGIIYIGKNWTAHWKQFGAGWFMDITFSDPVHATYFSLRWK